jgi:glycerophosphoryl diester phosphodiesterase
MASETLHDAKPDSPMLPPVIGHRGAAARAPENTLAGLRCAKALGCTWVEFDVRLTADGVPVLCHDSRLDRTTDGSGRVSAHSLAAVRSCDAGSWFEPAYAGERIPTLEEALLLCAELDLGANIEIKADRGHQHPIAKAVVAALQGLRGRLPAVLISTFFPSGLWSLRVEPHLPLGILFRVVPRNWAEIAARFDCAMIGADHHRLRPQRVAEIRAAGYQLAVYTVNDPARANLLFDWGVTSVFSDAPDIIRKVCPEPNPALVHSPTLARGRALAHSPALAR